MNYQTNLSNIIKYLRISCGLSQQDLAQIMNINRLKVQRIENLKSEMSFEEWLAFSDHFGLTSDDVKHGYLDIQEKQNDKEAFKVSKRLSSDAFSSGRILAIHKWNFERLFGKRVFEEFCETERMNPLFFTNLGSTLNMDFNMRLIESMLLKGKMRTKEEVRNFSRLVHGQTFHQSTIKKEIWSHESVERVYSFLQNHVHKYERNHSFVIEDFSTCPNKREIIFSYSPKEHVNMSLYEKPQIRDFFQNFIESYMTSMIEKPYHVKKLTTKIQGHDKFTLKISEHL